MINSKIYSSEIINNIAAGVSVLDSGFRIVWVNKAQADWFGLPQELYGKHCYEAYRHCDHICKGCPTQKVFKTGKSHSGMSIAPDVNGRLHQYFLTVNPIKDKDNHVLYAVELVQDVTLKKSREKHDTIIINKLKNMYQHLSSANKRLNFNLGRLKRVAMKMDNFNQNLIKKYHKKTNELSFMKEELRDIFKVNRTLATSLEFSKIASFITKITCELMKTDACILRLLDSEKGVLILNSSFCVSELYVKRLPILKVGEGISGKVAKTRQPIAIFDIDKDPRIRNREIKEIVRNEGFKSVLSVPILFRNKLLGVLTTYSKQARNFEEVDIGVLGVFASQVAIAIEESRHYEDIHSNYFNTMHALILAIEARDPYTRGHAERVTKFAVATARKLNLPREDIEILRYAGEVHDIGKISVSDLILNKPGRLTPAERAVIEIHPVKGAEMLEPLDFLKPAIPIIRHHHERFDGTGYPDGLEKQKIPLMARILACADAFDAMTSDRPYRRRSLTIEEAISEMRNNAGSQFDPEITHAFISVIHAKVPIKALASF